MSTSLLRSGNGIRLGAFSLAVSSGLLALFPIVRPFGDQSEVILSQAQAFASPLWWISHSLAGFGFVLLPLAFVGLHGYLQEGNMEKRAYKGMVLGILGSGLILPVIGVEAFALNTIGQAAVAQNNMDLLGLIDSVRMGPGFVFLISGLVLLALGGVLFATSIWKSGSLPRWGGLLFGVGLVIWLPLLPQAIRVIDGLIIGVGGVWVAAGMLRQGPEKQESPSM